MVSGSGVFIMYPLPPGSASSVAPPDELSVIKGCKLKVKWFLFTYTCAKMASFIDSHYVFLAVRKKV